MSPKPLLMAAILLATPYLSAAPASPSKPSVVLESLILTGDLVPGSSPGLAFADASNPRIDGAGNVLFLARVFEPGSADPARGGGTWVYTADGPKPLLNESKFPTLPGDEVFSGGAVVDFSAGRAIGGMLSRSPVDPSFLWHGSAGDLRILGVQGGQAPGLDAGESLGQVDTFRFFQPGSGLGLNPSQQLAFTMPIHRGGAAIGAGLWFGDVNSQQLALRTGDRAPGFDASITVATQSGMCCDAPLRFEKMSDAGQIALIAPLVGPGIDASNNYAVWLGTPDALIPVARSGDPAPELPPGVVYDRFLSAVVGRGRFSALNASTNDVSTLEKGEGLWVADSSSGAMLVASSGQLAPGFEATGATFAEIFRFSAPNDFGEIAFGARLSNGATGVWVGAPGAIRGVLVSGQPVPGDADSIFGLLDTSTLHIDNNGGVHVVGLGNGKLGEWLSDSTGEFHRLFRTGELLEVAPGDFRRVKTFSHANENANYAGQVTVAIQFEDGSSGLIRWNVVPEPDGVRIATLALACIALPSWKRGGQGRVFP